MDKWRKAVAVSGAVAIPLSAFLIRMYKGQYNNESEAIISGFVQERVDGMLKKLEAS